MMEEVTTCGKIGYLGPREAQTALKALIKAQRQKQRSQLRVYVCSVCGYHHIGHSRPRPRAGASRGTHR
jgi:rubrerythrin